MLQEGVNAYLASLSDKKSGENNSNTIVAYRNDLHQLSAYLTQFSLEDWRQVTREHINSYLLAMRDAQVYRPATIARKLASLKAFFRYLSNSGALESNPLKDIGVPRIQKESPQALCPEQVARLFRQVSIDTPVGQRDLAMLTLLYATGMRVSELVALNLDDLDITQSTVLCSGRSGKSHHEREVHLVQPVLQALQSYLHSARQQSIQHHPDEPALFVNHHGERLTRQGFWLIVKGYARQAGIIEITPQMLRHSFSTHIPQNGIGLQIIQEMLGLAQVAT